MKGVTIINDGAGRVQVAPAGDVPAFRAAAAKAVEAGPVRTITTEAGIGLDMTIETAKKAGFVKQQQRAKKAAPTNKE